MSPSSEETLWISLPLCWLCCTGRKKTQIHWNSFNSSGLQGSVNWSIIIVMSLHPNSITALEGDAITCFCDILEDTSRQFGVINFPCCSTSNILTQKRKDVPLLALVSSFSALTALNHQLWRRLGISALVCKNRKDAICLLLIKVRETKTVKQRWVLKCSDVFKKKTQI